MWTTIKATKKWNYDKYGKWFLVSSLSSFVLYKFQYNIISYINEIDLLILYKPVIR